MTDAIPKWQDVSAQRSTLEFHDGSNWWKVVRIGRSLRDVYTRPLKTMAGHGEYAFVGQTRCTSDNLNTVYNACIRCALEKKGADA